MASDDLQMCAELPRSASAAVMALYKWASYMAGDTRGPMSTAHQHRFPTLWNNHDVTIATVIGSTFEMLLKCYPAPAVSLYPLIPINQPVPTIPKAFWTGLETVRELSGNFPGHITHDSESLFEPSTNSTGFDPMRLWWARRPPTYQDLQKVRTE